MKDQTLQTIKEAVNEISDAVSVTLGARGKNVFIVRNSSIPIVTKDGVTVAQYFTLEDTIKNNIASYIRSVAMNTNDAVGDGTTTSVVLANALVNETIEALEKNPNTNVYMVNKGFQMGLVKTIDLLNEYKQTDIDDDILHSIANISTNNDEKLSELILDAFRKVNYTGGVVVKMSKTGYSYVEHSNGFNLKSGLEHPLFSTSTSELKAELRNVDILIYDGELNSLNKFKVTMGEIKMFNKYYSGENTLLIIAEKFSPEVLSTILRENKQNGAGIWLLKSEEFGKKKRQLLEDLAHITDATIVSDEGEVTLKTIKETDLGFADKVVIDENNTYIWADNPSKGYIEKLEKEKETLTNQYEIEFYDRRINNLTSGIATIYVGGKSEEEAVERKFRAEDAINSVRVAIEEGVIPGGGVPLFLISKAIKYEGDNSDINLGIEIFKKAIQSPFKKILENGGLDYSKYNISDWHTVVDVLTGEVVNPYIKGILDPVGVTKKALTNAISIAGTLLTTGKIIQASPTL